MHLTHDDKWTAFDRITGWYDLFLKASLFREGEEKYANKPGSQTGHNS